MAEARPFRGLRYNSAKVAPSDAIAPPYDVIGPEEQRRLYERSPYNVVRLEYGAESGADTPADSRYTRAAAAIDAWTQQGVLLRDDAPALYRYDQRFTYAGAEYSRAAYFALLRLEPWDAGVVKPHEYTLAGPKQDRLALLHATHTQISPIYSLYRPRAGAPTFDAVAGEPRYDFDADGQRHAIAAITDARAVENFARLLGASDVYIADGHHRYETALAYRDERHAQAATWTDEEPENFVLMALSDTADPGLLVLPTHRIVTPPSWPADALGRIADHFDVTEIAASADEAARVAADAPSDATVFAAAGLAAPGVVHLLTLRDRPAVEALMPAAQPPAWKRLDVNVLQYGILAPVFGIDDAALAAGGAVTYTQDPSAAVEASAKEGAAAFLLRATPIEQVLAVADAGGRMPQKSTYFYPKLPTGLIMYAMSA